MKYKLKQQLLFFVPIIILIMISLFNMFNAKIISDVYNNAFLKQLMLFIAGIFMIFILKDKIYINLFNFAPYYYLFTLFLLLLVLLFGKEINGARCWLNIFGFSFQPSEIMKIFLPLYLIYIQNKSKNNFIFKCIMTTIIPSVLVFLEPDTGAIITYFIILVVILINYKLNKKNKIIFLTITLLFLTTFFIMYFFYQDILINIMGTSIFYRMDRILNFKDNYQLENALISVGATNIFKFNVNDILIYIPEAPTDFFFSFAIGNYGIVCGLIILFSYLILDFFLIKITDKLKDKKHKIFIYCYLTVFIFHQIYNIGMNLGLLPIMGIPLPLLSYGGSNIIINFFFLSYIYNSIIKKPAITC